MTITQTIPDQITVRQPATLECCLSSYAITRVSYDEANALRKQPERLAGNLSYSVLRHLDEQTMACMAATGAAIQKYEGRPENFDRWGVVTSSRYLGRASFIQNLDKFSKEGPWNVSIQVVPNRSLHSPASTVGFALGCHGPCVGVGGGRDGETDAWISAVSLLEHHKLQGVWVVFCGWEPDELVDMEGKAINNAECTALAVALTPSSMEGPLARLRIEFDASAPGRLEVPMKATVLSQFEKSISSDSEGQPLTIQLGGSLKTVVEWAPAEITTISLPEQPAIMPKKVA